MAQHAKLGPRWSTRLNTLYRASSTTPTEKLAAQRRRCLHATSPAAMRRTQIPHPRTPRPTPTHPLSSSRRSNHPTAPATAAAAETHPSSHLPPASPPPSQISPTQHQSDELQHHTTTSAAASASAAAAATDSDARLAAHLDRLFAPLRFPPELARRLLTHTSHKYAAHGHNARFSFLGRRVLEAYLLLFLASAPSAPSTPSTQPPHSLLVQRTLNTYLLGEHLAPAWRLERVVRWAPAAPAARILERALRADRTRQLHRAGVQYIPLAPDSDRDAPAVDGDAPAPTPAPAQGEETRHHAWVDVRRLGGNVVQSVGMHKVLGDVAQGVLGGIFHQFGGTAAHRVFHTRVLPRLLLPNSPDGLPDGLHAHALDVARRMGSGPDDTL